MPMSHSDAVQYYQKLIGKKPLGQKRAAIWQRYIDQGQAEVEAIWLEQIKRYKEPTAHAQGEGLMPGGIGCLVTFGIIAYFFASLNVGFFLGCLIFFGIPILVGTIIASGAKDSVDEQNKSIAAANKRIDEETRERIQQVANRQLKLINKNLNEFDTRAESFVTKTLANKRPIEPIVAYTEGMLLRQIEHAKGQAGQKFMTAELTYTVQEHGIRYSYDSGYANPESDFSFFTGGQGRLDVRYRAGAGGVYAPMPEPYKQEGLARALAQLVQISIKKRFARAHTDASFNGSQATITVKLPNPSYQGTYHW